MFRRTAVCRIALLLFLFSPFGCVLVEARPEDVEVSEIEDESENQSPRGVYHFSDTDRDIETSFKIPDFEALDPIKVASDLMSSAMKVDTKRKTLAGIQMPFSLTGRPMNLQINGESHDAVSLVDDPKKHQNKKKVPPRRSDMSPESRQAFLRARQVCLEQSADSCDQALDTFHRVRYGKSLLMREDEDDNGETDQYKRIIERRLKETGQSSSPSTSSSTSSEDVPTSSSSTSSESHDPFVTSEATSSSESRESESEDVRLEENRPPRTHRFSHITLPKYHDKAHNFLRDIN